MINPIEFEGLKKQVGNSIAIYQMQVLESSNKDRKL